MTTNLTDEEKRMLAVTQERDWLAHLVKTIRDKAIIRFNGSIGILAFSDLKDEAAKTFQEHKRRTEGSK